MAPKPYEERFTVGTRVRILPREALEEFKRMWRYHNPIAQEQLRYAGAATVVREVGFYHGGDPLYVLEGIPGVWHEECLDEAE